MLRWRMGIDEMDMVLMVRIIIFAITMMIFDEHDDVNGDVNGDDNDDVNDDANDDVDGDVHGDANGDVNGDVNDDVNGDVDVLCITQEEKVLCTVQNWTASLLLPRLIKTGGEDGVDEDDEEEEVDASVHDQIVSGTT